MPRTLEAGKKGVRLRSQKPNATQKQTCTSDLSWFTPVMNFGLLYSHVILTISLLETLHHAFLWENINEGYPNTSSEMLYLL
jgi:hypothetical protein